MIPCIPVMPWRSYDSPYIPKLPDGSCWREVWFHVGGAHDVCGVFECMRSHRWKAVLYVWSVMVVAKFGFYWRVTDNRESFRCPYCDYPADRFIANWTFNVTLTAPPRQIAAPMGLEDPWPFPRHILSTNWPSTNWPHRLFPWE